MRPRCIRSDWRHSATECSNLKKKNMWAYAASPELIRPELIRLHLSLSGHWCELIRHGPELIRPLTKLIRPESWAYTVAFWAYPAPELIRQFSLYLIDCLQWFPLSLYGQLFEKSNFGKFLIPLSCFCRHFTASWFTASLLCSWALKYSINRFRFASWSWWQWPWADLGVVEKVAQHQYSSFTQHTQHHDSSFSIHTQHQDNSSIQHTQHQAGSFKMI